MAQENKYSSSVEYNDDNPWRSEDLLRKLYFEDEMSLPDIADRFDISHQAVIYWFDKHGIERRDRSDYSSDGVKDTIIPGKQTIFCSNCSDIFVIDESEIGERVFCSQECSVEGYQRSEFKKIWVECLECSDLFRGLPDRKFCCHECYWDSMYEGDRSIAELFRGRERDRGWVENVFEKDNWTCQSCGCRGGKLNAHHITPVAEIATEITDRSSITDHPLFNDIENGKTLCVECHTDIHW